MKKLEAEINKFRSSSFIFKSLQDQIQKETYEFVNDQSSQKIEFSNENNKISSEEEFNTINNNDVSSQYHIDTDSDKDN